ncbi:hypothetical protein GMA3_62 [Gordonia phage GMA3]|uniref:Uncharacterized protein n=1 Tax=Gordonia phage GMA3 TaxID=1647284 RepID=A0A0K0NKX4_9CAUD|nr:hypothetical protein AU105_gp062 [Gordonia phage GMA3]AKL88239.1 hypothetical protein GMA3_62 [Gordonia phage GMA3]
MSDTVTIDNRKLDSLISQLKACGGDKCKRNKCKRCQRGKVAEKTAIAARAKKASENKKSKFVGKIKAS